MEYIREAGPGGNFLQSEHTVDYYREEFFRPTLLERRDYEVWEKEGALTMEQRALEKVHRILKTHQAESLPENVLKEMDRIVAEAEKSVTVK